MLVFRLAGKAYVDDLSGAGARLYGGRWNPKGVAVVYTACTRSLAVLETLVHVPLAGLPEDLFIATIEVPDEPGNEAIEPTLLPANWRDYPAPPALAAMGADWLASRRSLLLRVPSSVIPEESNWLINPLHPKASEARIIARQAFRIDRLNTPSGPRRPVERRR
jgi:RES domain-containing protein